MVVIAVISVVEIDCGFVQQDFYETEQSKNLTMRFLGIVSSGLLSGSYYNEGGASDINASKTKIVYDHQFAPHRE